jgi:hypothetical protein
MASNMAFWFFLTSLTTSAFCSGDTRPKIFFEGHVMATLVRLTANHGFAHDGEFKEDFGDLFFQSKAQALSV